MNKEGIERRKTEALFDTGDKVWWWLSFADPSLPKGSQFLGVAIIRAANVWQACEFARYLYHCNPGGQVMGEPFYEDDIEPPPAFTNRLLNATDIDALKRIAAEARVDDVNQKLTALGVTPIADQP